MTIRVKIKEQWRDFESQNEAKIWAEKILNADVIYIDIDKFRGDK